MISKYDKYLKRLIVSIVFMIVVGVTYVTIITKIEPSMDINNDKKYEDTITVYADEDYEPYSFVDKEGKPQGYDVELMYMLAEEMGVNMELQLIPWTMNLDEGGVSNADIILGLEYTDISAEKFDLSHSVQINEYTAFGLESLDYTDQLYTKKMGVLQGSIVYELFIEPNNLQENTIDYPTYEEGFQAVLEGEIDYLIGRYSVGKRVLVSEDIRQIEPTGEILATNAFCFGVQKNQPELLEQLNEGIDTLNRSDDIHELSLKWLGHHVHITSLNDFMDIYLVQVIVLIGGVLIIVFYLILRRNAEFLKLKHERTLRETVQRQLEVDTLTGGLSYYKFEMEVKEKFQHKSPREYMLISIDVDDFKYINESYGYKIGNAVLKKISEYIITYLGDDDVITRISADKFIVLTKKVTEDTVSMIRSYNSPSFEELMEQNFMVTFSTGIYIPTDDTEALDYMIDCADAARLAAKANGKNNICYFSERMKKARLLKYNIVSSMEKALSNREFYMVYQPKYFLKTSICVGGEALVRWRTSVGTNYYPDQFIPVFENNGFIVDLDYYIMDEVCRFIASSKAKVPIISVNLSGKTLLKPSLVDDYCNILAKYDVLPSQIELEITESVFAKRLDDVKNSIIALSSAGFTVAMDDFGVGASSLNRLKNTHVDVLKIDREFLNQSLDGEKGELIIKNIMNMSKDLKITTVAEGIETKEQLELLQSMGCDIGQGYYFSKPLIQEEFEKILVL